MLDIDFVEMLEYGMPPTSCIGFSERLFWFLEGVSAREGTFFPQMKHETDDVTLNVYSDIKKYLVNETMVDFNIFNLEQRDVASIQPEVLKDNQGIKFGYVIFDNVKVLKESDYLNKLKDEILKKIPSKDEIKEDKNLEGYREIYKRNGVDPRSRLNSAEALLKRISSGKGLYSINNVVDTYNLTSIENKVAMAAYDFDQVVGEIKLRYAAAGEEMLKIGDEEVSKTFDKELIYADEKGPICFDFNYRDSDRTKITDKTQRIIVFVDGNKSVSEDEIVKVLNIVSSRMQKATGATAVGYGLSWQDASSKFFVGKVLEINKHPNADRLMISKVDIGHKTVQIITSATNVKVNDIVPVAITGAIIPNKLDSDGNNLVLESGSIRGELSEAMMCSMHELGKGEDAENIWILDNQQFSSKIGEIFEI
jgi:DNA/RNA-binding domain of Phe-tRNA-synthetase-like protein